MTSRENNLLVNPPSSSPKTLTRCCCSLMHQSDEGNCPLPTPTAHLVLKGGCETVVEHLLVKDWGDAARHGRHDPHPVTRAATPHPVLILHVLHERLGGRVMVHNGHFTCLAGGTDDRMIQKINVIYIIKVKVVYFSSLLVYLSFHLEFCTVFTAFYKEAKRS